MDLNEYLNSTGFTTDNLELLPSVGSVINTKTGDIFPMMADNTCLLYTSDAADE